MASTPSALLIATVAVLVILVIGAYGWYHGMGWSQFAFQQGAEPRWAGGGDVSRLRFRDAVFTVARPDGQTVSRDVTPVLNSMAVAYAGAASKPGNLTLTAPLNPFSFTIPGFNDSATVSDPSAPVWTGAGVGLTGYARAI